MPCNNRGVARHALLACWCQHLIGLACPISTPTFAFGSCELGKWLAPSRRSPGGRWCLAARQQGSKTAPCTIRKIPIGAGAGSACASGLFDGILPHGGALSSASACRAGAVFVQNQRQGKRLAEWPEKVSRSDCLICCILRRTHVRKQTPRTLHHAHRLDDARHG